MCTCFEISSPTCLKLGNGRNAVSRLLSRKRELAEFCGKLGEFCEKLGEFALAHKQKAERSSLSSLPGTRRGSNISLSSVFETALSETVFGPFPTNPCKSVLLVRVSAVFGLLEHRVGLNKLGAG